MLKVDNIDLQITDSALEYISEICEEMNFTEENLGARRLFQILNTLFEEISYEMI